MKKALCDKDPSVMACALNYFLEAVKKSPEGYKDLYATVDDGWFAWRHGLHDPFHRLGVKHCSTAGDSTS